MPPKPRGRPVQGLEQLREGVERAVKSVLGDETAALKRAQSELEDLGDQLDREIAEATGSQPPNRIQVHARSLLQDTGAMRKKVRTRSSETQPRCSERRPSGADQQDDGQQRSGPPRQGSRSPSRAGGDLPGQGERQPGEQREQQGSGEPQNLRVQTVNKPSNRTRGAARSSR